MPAASVRRPAACCRGPDCGLRGDGGGRGSRELPSPRPEAWSLSGEAGCAAAGSAAAAAVAAAGRSLRRSRSLRPERSPRPPRPRPEPERPPPLRPPRPRPKRPRFSSGAYLGPSPTLSGSSALRMSRSMNFSIWWNLPCSSSLTNVMAAPRSRRAGRTADAVDVVLGVVRHVVVEHQARCPSMSIPARRRCPWPPSISTLPFLIVEHHLLALRLLQVGVHGPGIVVAVRLERRGASSFTLSFDDEKIMRLARRSALANSIADDAQSSDGS